MNNYMAAARLDTLHAAKDVTAFDPQIGGTPVPAFDATSGALKSYVQTGWVAICSISYPYQLRWLQGIMGWTGAQAAFTMNTSAKFRYE